MPKKEDELNVQFVAKLGKIVLKDGIQIILDTALPGLSDNLVKLAEVEQTQENLIITVQREQMVAAYEQPQKVPAMIAWPAQSFLDKMTACRNREEGNEVVKYFNSLFAERALEILGSESTFAGFEKTEPSTIDDLIEKAKDVNIAQGEELKAMLKDFQLAWTLYLQLDQADTKAVIEQLAAEWNPVDNTFRMMMEQASNADRGRQIIAAYELRYGQIQREAGHTETIGTFDGYYTTFEGRKKADINADIAAVKRVSEDLGQLMIDLVKDINDCEEIWKILVQRELAQTPDPEEDIELPAEEEAEMAQK